MKKTTMAGALALAWVMVASGVDAQRPAWGGGPRGGGPGGGEGVLQLERTVQATLDRAEIAGLTESQVAELRQLRDEVQAATEVHRAEMLARREAQRQERQAFRGRQEPLPTDPEARAAALGARRAQAEAWQAQARVEAQEFRSRVSATFDPLVQRYEQLVPPSQRPRLDRAAGRDGRPGPGARNERGPRSGRGAWQDGRRGRGRR